MPTLYDLLLPKRTAKDSVNVECRPDTFRVGRREFDAEKVGFVATGDGSTFLFDVGIEGNSNKGHEYRARDFSERDRWALVEYMKTL